MAREQVADTERHVVARLDPEYREQENEQRRNRWSNPGYTEQENEQRRNRRLDPEYTEQENEQRHIDGVGGGGVCHLLISTCDLCHILIPTCDLYLVRF